MASDTRFGRQSPRTWRSSYADRTNRKGPRASLKSVCASRLPCYDAGLDWYQIADTLIGSRTLLTSRLVGSDLRTWHRFWTDDEQPGSNPERYIAV